MIARAMPFAGIASRKAVASSGGIGFVRRSIRGLREKIWIASAPTDLPRSGASAILSAMETWAPRNMLPRAAIAFARMSLPIWGRPRSALSSRRLVRGRELPRLHDQIRQGQLLLAPGERIREFLPAAVLDPSSNDRIPKEQLDLTQLVEPRHGRVDAHERDLKAVVLEQVRHHVLVEGPLGTPPGFLPMVPVMAAEDERSSRAEGPRRVPHDFRRHAQVADDRVDWISGEFMVRRLVDIAEDELDVPDVADARVRPGVHQLRAVEVHPDDPRAGVCRGEREPPLSRADIQHDLSAKVLVPKLFHQHRTEGVGLFRRLPPRQRAALAHDVRHDVLGLSQGTRGIRGTGARRGKTHAYSPRPDVGAERRWKSATTACTSPGSPSPLRRTRPRMSSTRRRIDHSPAWRPGPGTTSTPRSRRPGPPSIPRIGGTWIRASEVGCCGSSVSRCGTISTNSRGSSRKMSASHCAKRKATSRTCTSCSNIMPGWQIKFRARRSPSPVRASITRCRSRSE